MFGDGTRYRKIRIFISYRRGSDGGLAIQLSSILRAEFGSDSVFLDEQSIRPGEQFRWAIDRAASVCEVMVVLIGPDWSPRCIDPRDLLGDLDFVKYEVDVALKRKIHVLPVLLNDTSMPSKNDLPTELVDLTAYQAMRIARERPAEGFEEIVRILGEWLSSVDGGTSAAAPLGQGGITAAVAAARVVGVRAPADAVEQLQEARRRNESDPVVWNELGAYLAEAGLSVEAEDCYRRVIDSGRDRDQGLWVAIGERGLSKISEDRGEYVMATEHVSRGLAALAPSTSPTTIEIEAIVKLHGRPPTPTQIRAYQDAVGALAGSVSVEHARVLGTLHSQMAALAEIEGDMNRAEYCHYFALSICSLSDDPEGFATNALNVGSLARSRGDLVTAEGWYRHALHLAKEADVKTVIAIAKVRMARIRKDRAQLDDAERELREAEKIADEAGSVLLRAEILRDLANLLLQHRQFDAARDLHAEVLRIERQLHRMPAVAAQYHNLAVVAQSRGDFPTAEAMYSQALQINQAIGRRRVTALQHSCLGLLHAGRGALDRAELELDEAKRISQEFDDKRTLGQVLLNLGHVRELGEQYESAEQLFRNAASLLDAVGEPEHQATAWLRVGRISFRTGSGTGGTFNALRNAYDRASVANHAGLKGEALAALGALCEAMEKFGDAKVYYEASLKQFEGIAPDHAGIVAEKLRALRKVAS